MGFYYSNKKFKEGWQKRKKEVYIWKKFLLKLEASLVTFDLHHVRDILKEALGPDLVLWSYHFDHHTVEVYSASLVRVATLLRDHPHLKFKQLVDICGVDYPERPQRFDVVYHFLSYSFNNRLRLKIRVEEESPVPSLHEVFASSSWYEREMYDLYGILFSDHPDLRRLLTDYHFDGYPLRKDFPLSGYVEGHFDERENRIVYESVTLPQNFRSFDYLSPWEGELGSIYKRREGIE